MRQILLSGFFLLLMIILSTTPSLLAQQDEEGCHDHPLFNRMPNYYISSCESKEYDQVDFINEKGEDIVVEGKVSIIDYWLKEGFTPPGELKILRNFEDAVKKIGGTIVKSYRTETYLKIQKPDKIIWIAVDTSNGSAHYSLTIVEETLMAQEIVADPKALAESIASTGHASVYGIYFDLDSDVIKPESGPTLEAIARLLKDHPDLKVYVVGHSDMTGSLEHNLDLSLRRAKSVVGSLVTQFKIEASRLSPQGIGPLSPVSTNKTDEGKKLNRRVELVEML